MREKIYIDSRCCIKCTIGTGYVVGTKVVRFAAFVSPCKFWLMRFIFAHVSIKNGKDPTVVFKLMKGKLGLTNLGSNLKNLLMLQVFVHFLLALQSHLEIHNADNIRHTVCMGRTFEQCRAHSCKIALLAFQVRCRLGVLAV